MVLVSAGSGVIYLNLTTDVCRLPSDLIEIIPCVEAIDRGLSCCDLNLRVLNFNFKALPQCVHLLVDLV